MHNEFSMLLNVSEKSQKRHCSQHDDDDELYVMIDSMIVFNHHNLIYFYILNITQFFNFLSLTRLAGCCFLFLCRLKRVMNLSFHWKLLLEDWSEHLVVFKENVNYCTRSHDAHEHGKLKFKRISRRCCKFQIN